MLPHPHPRPRRKDLEGLGLELPEGEHILVATVMRGGRCAILTDSRKLYICHVSGTLGTLPTQVDELLGREDVCFVVWEATLFWWKEYLVLQGACLPKKDVMNVQICTIVIPADGGRPISVRYADRYAFFGSEEDGEPFAEKRQVRSLIGGGYVLHAPSPQVLQVENPVGEIEHVPSGSRAVRDLSELPDLVDVPDSQTPVIVLGWKMSMMPKTNFYDIEGDFLQTVAVGHWRCRYYWFEDGFAIKPLGFYYPALHIMMYGGRTVRITPRVGPKQTSSGSLELLCGGTVVAWVPDAQEKPSQYLAANVEAARGRPEPSAQEALQSVEQDPLQPAEGKSTWWVACIDAAVHIETTMSKKRR